MPKPILSRSPSKDLSNIGGRNSPLPTGSSIGHKIINMLLVGKKQNSLSESSGESGSGSESSPSQFGMLPLKPLITNDPKQQQFEDDGGVYKGPDM